MATFLFGETRLSGPKQSEKDVGVDLIRHAVPRSCTSLKRAAPWLLTLLCGARPISLPLLATDKPALLRFVNAIVREAQNGPARLATQDEPRRAGHIHLHETESESANLYEHLLAGLASPARPTMITERSLEDARLSGNIEEARVLSIARTFCRIRQCLRASRQGVLCASFDDKAIRTEVTVVLTTLDDRVRI